MKFLLGDRLYDTIHDISSVTEIRIRKNSPILIKNSRGSSFCNYTPTVDEIKNIAIRAMQYSPYAFEDRISSGFLPYTGGVRIGLAGKGKVIADSKLTFPEITSLCIRLPHEVKGAADVLPSDFYTSFSSTLLFSPPYCGKTTLIRDMARILSGMYDTLIIDEREELCPENGTFEKGIRADVIQNIPKNKLYENVIRAMSPEIVVCDELFGVEDIEAMKRFSYAGIACLASIHANNIEDIPDNLLSSFSNFVQLSRTPKMGTIISVRRNRNGY